MKSRGAAPAEQRHCRRPGDDLPEGDGKGPRAAVSDGPRFRRRPAALAAVGADPRSTRGDCGSCLPLVPAISWDGGTVGRDGRARARNRRRCDRVGNLDLRGPTGAPPGRCDGRAQPAGFAPDFRSVLQTGRRKPPAGRSRRAAAVAGDSRTGQERLPAISRAVRGSARAGGRSGRHVVSSRAAPSGRRRHRCGQRVDGKRGRLPGAVLGKASHPGTARSAHHGGVPFSPLRPGWSAHSVESEIWNGFGRPQYEYLGPPGRGLSRYLGIPA